MIFPIVKEKRQVKNYVFNPDTRRVVVLNGPTLKRLLTKYPYDQEKNLFITTEEPQPLFNGEYWEINKSPSTEEAKKLIIQERTTYGEQKKSKYLQMYFYNNITSLTRIHESLDTVYQNENNAIKLNIVFGYVTVKDEKVKLIRPGHNYFFNEPWVMKKC